jgi:hypothetical protein
MHVVQVRRFPAVVPHPDPGGAWPAQEPDVTDVMLLEHCHRGSLHKALCKVYETWAAGQQHFRFPNRALWHIFHCRKQIWSL